MFKIRLNDSKCAKIEMILISRKCLNLRKVLHQSNTESCLLRSIDLWP
jgi:hypothetical protein